MAYKKTCEYCEHFFGCQYDGTISEKEGNKKGCDDWHIAFRYFQDMTEEEIKELDKL